ncbi:hypothetical protein [Micromonospora sp. WMMD812]|uniref:hypothetical protein n=1 Tax=Micromonospora sp. WMMD812 TaxID=3015152 RepID=UPI00248B245C|nr:hypothetical protein [Micromonospora sp. WMMD812]WBB69618.1 hypothetical protein O7603_09805 [Micromonospora sp. WMMD812]
MKVRSIRLPLIAVGLVATAATLSYAPSASATTTSAQRAALADGAPLTSIAVGGAAKIDANGAAIHVPVTLTCAQRTGVDLTVKVAQAIGESMRTGTTTRKVVCEGTTRIRIAVTPVEHPFAPGVAFGTVTGNSCDALCNSLVDERRVDLAL